MKFTEDLPADDRQRPTKYSTQAAEAQAHWGQWGLLREVSGRNAGARARLMAHYVRTGRLAAFRPAGEYQAATRVRNLSSGGLTVDVWVRYVGHLTSTSAMTLPEASS